MKVSIIIPVYNGEKFIPKCLNSLINQSYKNIEIIVINDGSKDNSLNILKEFSAIDKRIKVIDKKNAGVSLARNDGLKEASGEYIMFCDIDDWLEEDTVSIAMEEIKNYDMLRYNERKVYDDGKIVDKELNPQTLIKNEFDLIINDMFNLKIDGHIYDFVYKKKIIDDNNITFSSNISFCEDIVFIFKYLKYANNLKIISNVLYNYYQNSNSATKNIKSIIKNFNSFAFINKEFKNIFKNNRGNNFLLNLSLIYLEKVINGSNNKEVLKNLKLSSIALKNFFVDIDLSSHSCKWKILAFLIKNKLTILIYIYIKLYIIIR